MSCSSNKTTVVNAFTPSGYSASVANVLILEETKTSFNYCLGTSVRGKIELDLTDFPNGDCQVYFLCAPWDDGSSNNPPVTANSVFHAALSATMGQVNTSDYYGNSTPSFSSGNDCSATAKKLGWILNDVSASVNPSFTYNV